MRHLAAILPLPGLACARPARPVSAEDSGQAADSARLAREFTAAQRVLLDSMRNRRDDSSTRCFQVEAVAPRPGNIQALQRALDTLPSGYYGARPQLAEPGAQGSGGPGGERRSDGPPAADALPGMTSGAETR